MYLRRITQFTSSSSAKLLLSTTSTTSSALLQNKNYHTSTREMMIAAAASAQAAARLSSPKKFSSRHGHASSNFFSSKKTRGFQQKRSFSLTTRAMGAKVGDKISGVLQLGPWIDGMPTPVDMAERCKGKKVFLIGLPGASLLFFPFYNGIPSPLLSILILILMENTKEFLRFFYVYAYRRKENNAFTDHVAIFFQVLSHLHDPRVKFRVLLPDKTN
jgi:hypothetical protein